MLFKSREVEIYLAHDATPNLLSDVVFLWGSRLERSLVCSLWGASAGAVDSATTVAPVFATDMISSTVPRSDRIMVTVLYFGDECCIQLRQVVRTLIFGFSLLDLHRLFTCAKVFKCIARLRRDFMYNLLSSM